MMRRLIAWGLYWLGHLASRWNDNDRRFTEAGFAFYQWAMLRSVDVQGDGPGPWLPAPCDTRPQGGDASAAPFTGSAVPAGQAPNE